MEWTDLGRLGSCPKDSRSVSLFTFWYPGDSDFKMIQTRESLYECQFVNPIHIQGKIRFEWLGWDGMN